MARKKKFSKILKERRYSNGCPVNGYLTDSHVRSVLDWVPQKIVHGKEMKKMSTPQDAIWAKFVGYLKGLEPRIYISKSVRILVEEALKADPNSARLQAIKEFLDIVARPEPQTKNSKFTF